MRLFAVWSYKQTLNWITNPDPRSVEAANVAERFAYGKASDKELAEASFAASLAARSAWLAARSAWLAAKGAVLSAYSASSTAKSAAESTVTLAAMEATAMARSSWSAWSGKSSAESAVELAQRDKLIEMILEER